MRLLLAGSYAILAYKPPWIMDKVRGGDVLPGQINVTQEQFENISLAAVTELWSGKFGKLNEIWFDGGISARIRDRVVALLETLQPDAVTYGMHEYLDGRVCGGRMRVSLSLSLFIFLSLPLPLSLSHTRTPCLYDVYPLHPLLPLHTIKYQM